MKQSISSLLLCLLSVFCFGQPNSTNLANLKGNWLKPGTDEWVLGIRDSVIIYKAKVWTFKQDENADNIIVLKLVNNAENKTLYIKKKTEDYYAGEKQNALMLLSKAATKPAGKSNVATSSKRAIFKNDSVTYRGYLQGYSTKLGFNTGQVIVNNIITGLQETHLITIRPDGTFYARFPMHYPQEVFVRMTGAFTNIYCEPGKKLFQVFNLNNDTEKPLMMGDLAAINNELASARHLANINYPIVYRKDFTPDEYKKFYQTLIALQLDTLNKFKASVHLSDAAYRLLKSTIIFSNTAQLFEYKYYRTQNGYSDLSPDKSYYLDFLKNININDAQNCESTFFRFFINRLKYIDIADFNQSEAMSTSALFKNMKTYIQFTPAELKVMASFPETLDFLNHTRDTIKLGYQQKEFLQKYEQQMLAAYWEHHQQLRYQKLKQLLNVPDGLAINLMKTQDMLQNMVDFFLPYNDTQLKQIKNYMTEPYLFAYIKQSNEGVKKKIEENKRIKQGFVINKTVKTPSDSLFNSMIRKFKGKVVYMDFWATWCVPCLDDIERMAPLKKELEHENVAFVYVTNQSSPLTTYNNRIPAIKGEHFRLSTDEWNVLSSKFQVGGLPHSVLIDKNGNVIDPDVRQKGPQILKKRFQELSAQ